ncbi:hypothetical protein SAMN05880574_11559 [Chryseobacterium sp. RU37D]|nr:hypothetical protein SAMN05880574_11559 [Chryseobacterium sp. RU37D]
MFHIVSPCFTLFQNVTFFNDKITNFIPNQIHRNEIETNKMYMFCNIKF